MVTKSQDAAPLVVEIDGPRNNSWSFPAMSRVIRGKFDLLRVAEPNAVKLRQQYPDPIPGQQLCVDLSSGECAVLEPLQDDAHETLRKKLEKSYSIAPAREVVSGADVSTWLFWIKKAVKAGIAKVISGSIPDKLPGEPKVRNLFGTERRNPQQDLQRALLGVLFAGLSESQKAEVKALMGE